MWHGGPRWVEVAGSGGGGMQRLAATEVNYSEARTCGTELGYQSRNT